MNSKGFSLIEVLLAISILGFIVVALVGSLIFGHQSTVLAGERARATILAEEGLEAVRSIRDAGFSSLTDGPHGLAVSSNQWTLSGTSDVTDDFFTRIITISTVDDDRKLATSSVVWSQTPQRSGTVSLTTYFTNWSKSIPINACDIYCQSLGTYITGTCRENIQQCTVNDEIYESGGDLYCTGGASEDTCCCAP